MYSKSDIGRSSNDRGRMFESLIEKGCQYYKIKGLAMIEKTPEPFRVKRKSNDGSFTGYFTGHAQPDFKGTLANGRSICFEAKVTSTKKLNQNVVTDNQAECLNIHQELGAYVGVCCMVNKTAAFIPWHIWKDMKFIYGHKYMTEEDLKEFEVMTPGFIDFLKRSDDGYSWIGSEVNYSWNGR